MNCIIPFIAITLFALIGIGAAMSDKNEDIERTQIEQYEVKLRLPNQKFTDMIDGARFEVDNS